MRKYISLLSALLCLLPANLSAEEYDDGIAKKAEFRVELGGSLGTNKDKALITEIGLGYNFTSNVYAGVITGMFVNYGYCLGGNPGSYLPTMAELSFRLNEQESDQISGFLSLRAGMLWNMKGKEEIQNYTAPYTPIEYTYQDYVTVEVMPGFIWRPKRNLDVRISAGYCLAVPGDDGYNPHLTKTEHSLTARIGLAFRGKPTSGTRREVRLHNLEETYRRQRAAEEKRQLDAEIEQLEAEERAAADREARRQEREDAARRRSAANGEIK